MSVGSPSTAPALLPLGQSLGPRATGLLFDVRVGDQLLQLDPVRWAVWSLAHGLPDAVASWTADDVALQATAAGLPDVAPVLADLRADGLLVDVPTANAAELAAGVRLMVALPALGNTAEEPDAWSLGLPGRPLLTMDDAVYDVVVLGHRDPDLWTTVGDVAASRARLGVPDETVRDPGRLLDRVLGALPLLLATGAVYLDRAVQGVRR